MIKELFFNRQERKRQEHQRQGYDYAIGALMRGETTVEKLEAYSSGPNRNEFDHGITKAIRAYACHLGPSSFEPKNPDGSYPGFSVVFHGGQGGDGATGLPPTENPTMSDKPFFRGPVLPHHDDPILSDGEAAQRIDWESLRNEPLAWTKPVVNAPVISAVRFRGDGTMTEAEARYAASILGCTIDRTEEPEECEGPISKAMETAYRLLQEIQAANTEALEDENYMLVMLLEDALKESESLLSRLSKIGAATGKEEP